MACCITTDDLLNYPRCCSLSNQICCPHEAIQEAINLACERASVLLCQDYCPYEGCKTFDGTGSCKLFMNQSIVELYSVNLIQCASHCEDSCSKGCEDGELPCISGSILEYRCKGDFPCGTKNIEVCGVWGTEMPASVKKAIIFLAMEEISPGALGLTACDNVRSVTWDDFSITYNGSESPDYTTGFREIDQLLIPYINSEAQLVLGTTSDCNCKKDTCRKCNSLN